MTCLNKLYISLLIEDPNRLTPVGAAVHEMMLCHKERET